MYLRGMNLPEIIVNSLNYCTKEKGLEIYAWCIMSNHVHLIISCTQGRKEEILRDHKRHTTKACLEAIGNNIQESRKDWMLWMFRRAGKKNLNNQIYQFWQQHNKPIELHSNFLLEQKLNYIHNNPVEAGLVDQPEEYRYSSARDYCGMRGLINIKLIE
jgi:putative transposase